MSRRPVVVVGAGVSGLSCAVLLAEAGHPVRVVTRDPPLATTSAVAAALWYPYLAEPRGRVLAWAAATAAELAALAAAGAPGVRLRQMLEVSLAPLPEPWWASALPGGVRRATAEELPPACADGYFALAPVASMPHYLPWLAERLAAAGGRLELVPDGVRSLPELGREGAVVVHCSGLGARELAADSSLLPVRGQVVRVAAPGVARVTVCESPDITYVVPREDDCILGGTVEPALLDRQPDPRVAEEILARARRLEPRLEDARLLESRVGFRPGRPAVRLEREEIDGVPVVHDYGHGGAGVTLSWGCAREVVGLVAETE